MSKYTANISWERKGEKFIDNKYPRLHHWKFDGGETIAASSSPQVVPTPLSDPSAVDPEEAFTASLSSCHMLWFLTIAAKRGFVVNQYVDKAEGVMGKDQENRFAITEVTLRPQVVYSKSSAPSKEEDAKMHNEAHEKCFLANSVKTKIIVEPSFGRTNAR